jgi:SAM-dependent methyltransferase
MLAIETYFPSWRDLLIHESSPGKGGASARLARECPRYLPSHFYQDKTPGETVKGIRSENLEAMTFADESIDLHITQDVMEHVIRPAKVFREIARTLKPGGAHIFTVPLVNKAAPSKVRAQIDQAGDIEYLEPAEYHGNPISDEGSLVTVDWGFDICRHIFESCGLFTHMIVMDDLSKGVRAEYIEVLITFKGSDNGPMLQSLTR